jgi:hypothetical protein
MNSVQTVQPTDKLKFRYVAAYLVEGIQSPANGPLLLHSDAEQGREIYLTGHTHEGLHHIDTAVTIANLILNASFQNGILDLGEVRNHVPTVYQGRIQRYGASGAFLVVEASHEQEAAAIGQIGQSDNREFCLALPNGFMDATRERHKKFLDQVQAFLAFAMPSVTGFERVGHCIVANHPSGKPLYVLSFAMTGRLSVSSAIPAGGPEMFAALYRHSSELADFQTAFRLAAGSGSNARDNLRAFLFAFTALEVFVGKFSNQYGAQLDLLTEKDHSPKIQAHLEAITTRGKGACAELQVRPCLFVFGSQ